MSDGPALNPPLRGAGRKPDWRFLVAHPAHPFALGFGSGLSPVAPGTAGTLFAWLIWAQFLPETSEPMRALVLLAAALVAWWSATVTSRHLAQGDPSAIVCDEIVAFWLVLWLVTPAGLGAQAAAFVLFRFFDAVKPGPVAGADQRFKLRRGKSRGWAQGFGILFDDVIAALCTVFLIAVWRFV